MDSKGKNSLSLVFFISLLTAHPLCIHWVWVIITLWGQEVKVTMEGPEAMKKGKGECRGSCMKTEKQRRRNTKVEQRESRKISHDDCCLFISLILFPRNTGNLFRHILLFRLVNWICVYSWCRNDSWCSTLQSP